jgi:hypothetical protein
MAWPTTKVLSRYIYTQLKGNFLGFIVGTSATSFVSTFFETRKISNLWGLTARKTVVSGSTFHYLEWFCALVVGFITFEVVNKLVKERLSIQLEKISSEASSPSTSKSIKLIARFTKGLVASGKNGTEPVRKNSNYPL